MGTQAAREAKRTDGYINCMAHNASEGNLLLGETHAALIDCGMAFCAGDTIQRVKRALCGRPLDYVFLTHTHYDHVGALPFFRKEWPALRVVTSEVGAAVLLRDTPRRVIGELSAVAAKAQGIALNTAHGDDAYHADVIVKDGERISLGGLTVTVLETPGHTRDSLSFFIPEMELLILCETMGVLMPDGRVYPCYLTSYADAINAIERCRAIRYRYLSLPHRGLVSGEDADAFFDKAVAANRACHDFILDRKDMGLDEEQILAAFRQKYSSDVLSSYQPIEAFMANARATIACTLRE